MSSRILILLALLSVLEAFESFATESVNKLNEIYYHHIREIGFLAKSIVEKNSDLFDYTNSRRANYIHYKYTTKPKINKVCRSYVANVIRYELNNLKNMPNVNLMEHLPIEKSYLFGICKSEFRRNINALARPISDEIHRERAQLITLTMKNISTERVINKFRVQDFIYFMKFLLNVNNLRQAKEKMMVNSLKESEEKCYMLMLESIREKFRYCHKDSETVTPKATVLPQCSSESEGNAIFDSYNAFLTHHVRPEFKKSTLPYKMILPNMTQQKSLFFNDCVEKLKENYNPDEEREFRRWDTKDLEYVRKTIDDKISELEQLFDKESNITWISNDVFDYNLYEITKVFENACNKQQIGSKTVCDDLKKFNKNEVFLRWTSNKIYRMFESSDPKFNDVSFYEQLKKDFYNNVPKISAEVINSSRGGITPYKLRVAKLSLKKPSEDDDYRRM